MLPGGNLYVPGAETLAAEHPQAHRCRPSGPRLSGFARLLSRQGRPRVRDLSSALRQRHARRGICSGSPDRKSRHGPKPARGEVAGGSFSIPADSSRKADARHLCQPARRRTGEALRSQDVEFVVFGVVTEFCVNFAAKGLLERGRRVSVVQDAIETLNPKDGQRTISELKAGGARFITTDQALELLNHRS